MAYDKYSELLLSDATTVGKQIPLKEITSKTGGPLKYKDMLEDEKGKQVRTHADIVSARRATDRISHGEEGSKFKKC